jgi:hypothetical protein
MNLTPEKDVILILEELTLEDAARSVPPLRVLCQSLRGPPTETGDVARPDASCRRAETVDFGPCFRTAETDKMKVKRAKSVLCMIRAPGERLLGVWEEDPKEPPKLC